MQKYTLSKPKPKKISIHDILQADAIWKSLKTPKEETSNLELSYELDRLSSQLESILRNTEDTRKAIDKIEIDKRKFS